MSNTAPDQLDEWTISRVLRFATEDFQKRNQPSPRLDAELLLGEVLGLDRVQLLIQSSRALSAPELALFRGIDPTPPAAASRWRTSSDGESSTAEPSRSNRRVLVPRPETELLVEVALRRTQHRHLSGRALDLCTGGVAALPSPSRWSGARGR